MDKAIEAGIRAIHALETSKSFEECYGKQPLEHKDDVEMVRAVIVAALPHLESVELWQRRYKEARHETSLLEQQISNLRKALEECSGDLDRYETAQRRIDKALETIEYRLEKALSSIREDGGSKWMQGHLNGVRELGSLLERDLAGETE